jgi:hypothetical protein
MGRKPLPRSPFLNARFSAAVYEFGVALKKTASIQHRGNKGGAREEPLRTFFRDRLPNKYAVAEGEVVDLVGQTSPQLDIMIYDQSTNFALNDDLTKILPAEALLASVEVKSSLNKNEIEKSVRAARKLRQLRPYNRDLGGVDVGSQSLVSKKARYYHCIFSYETDLVEENWMKHEAARFVSLCKKDHLIDAVYVLNRGLLNIPSDVGMLEDENGGAITNLYFSILNFVQREARRRQETPFSKYVTHSAKAWSKLT